VLRTAKDAFLLVVNAANRAKDLAWLRQHGAPYGVRIIDLSEQVAMMALQGPRAEAALAELTDADLRGLRWHSFTDAQVAGVRALVARMGYTGEDGFELYVWGATPEKPEKALSVWEVLLEAGSAFGIKPCGLGARDTLRLEAGYRLYGQDMDEQTTPYEAGLEFAVDLAKEDFLGKAALAEQVERGPGRKLACLRLLERGVPRAGFPVLDAGGREVGHITSGTFSPLLKCGIAMAYLPPELAEPGAEVLVAIRKRRARALVVEPPFYDPEKYGRKRKEQSP